MYYYEETTTAAMGRTPAEAKVYRYVDCSVVEKSPTALTATCKPNTLVKTHRQEGEGVAYQLLLPSGPEVVEGLLHGEIRYRRVELQGGRV
jgi:hypothetical protein